MSVKPKSLYYPLQKALITLQQIEENDGELTAELAEQFTLTTEKVEERAEAMVDTRCECLMIIAEAKRKIEQANQLISQTEKAIALIDKGLLSGVEFLGNIQAGAYKLSVSRSEVTVITNDLEIPDEYIKPIVMPKIPDRGEPDKVAIKKAINSGIVVPGAYIQKKSTIKIK